MVELATTGSRVKWRIGLILLGFVAALVAAESIFRFLPVRQSGFTVPVTAAAPFIHFKENRSFYFSKGWNFSIVQRKTSNNYGYLSDVEYRRETAAPLMVVVGDSYVEAAQVANGESVHGHLGVLARANGAQVYGIGYSGAALAQYLAFAQFARDRFSPAALVVVIVGNDFDESLRWYKSDAGFHYFNRRPDGRLFLELLEWRGPSLMSQLLQHSALGMYLLGNLELRAWIRSLWGGTNNEQFVGNVRREAEAQRLADSKEAVDEFLGLLPELSGLAPSSILLVTDGLRPHLYDDSERRLAHTSYAAQMFSYIRGKAVTRGFRVLDLEPVFVDHFKAHGLRFEFPDDAHWNALGHRVTAEAIWASGITDALGKIVRKP